MTELDDILTRMGLSGYCLVLFSGQMFEAAFVKWGETDKIPNECFKSMDLLSAVKGAEEMAGEESCRKQKKT